MFEIVFLNSFNEDLYYELLDIFGNSIFLQDDPRGKRIILDASIETFYQKWPYSFRVQKFDSTIDAIIIT